MTVRLGLTLPSFQSDPEVVIEVARAAEASGVNGVFAFDHLFRLTRTGEPRPALELTTVLAAVAAETTTITVGSLVARAGLRPPASLVAALDTVERIAPGRLIAGVGSGDGESEAEDLAFGIDSRGFGGVPRGGGRTVADRLARLAATVSALRDRSYPVWVGGRSPAVRRLAATGASGWNRWSGDAAAFARGAADVAAVAQEAGREPESVVSTWGGLAVLGASPAEAEAKMDRLGRDRGEEGLIWGGPEQAAERVGAYVEAGAAWVILGPIDSSDPDNAALIGAVLGELR